MTPWLQRLASARERGVLAPDEFWIVLLGTVNGVRPDRVVATVLHHLDRQYEPDEEFVLVDDQVHHSQGGIRGVDRVCP